jgi:hypothetical protein
MLSYQHLHVLSCFHIVFVGIAFRFPSLTLFYPFHSGAGAGAGADVVSASQDKRKRTATVEQVRFVNVDCLVYLQCDLSE